MKQNSTRSFSSTPLGAFMLFCFSRTMSKKRPYKAFQKAEQLKPFDAIIVPGVPFTPDKWDYVMKARVLWSYVLYQKGIAKNIIYSGAAVYTPYIEAKIMAAYAKAIGIPEQHIFCDTHAKHSTENIFYSYLIAKQQGFKTLALATDPFQSFFLKWFTKRHFGTPIFHLPLIQDMIREYDKLNPTIDATVAKAPQIQPESFWEHVKGTLGRNIQWHNYKQERLSPL